MKDHQMKKLTDTITRRDIDAVLAFYASGLYDDGGKLAKEALAIRKAAKRKRDKASRAKLVMALRPRAGKAKVAIVPPVKLSKAGSHASH
jgi:hypothetical protein